MPPLLLLPLQPLLLLFLTFPVPFVFLGFDAVPLLKFSQAKRVVCEGLECGLLLLFNCKKGILTDFGCNVTSIIGVLNGDKILVRRSEL